MKKAAFFIVLAAAALLVLPALSFADEPANPALLACKAEAVRIGEDAFKAKYGATEPFQACIKENGGAPVTAAPTPPVPTGPEVECKAEFARIGEDAFKAKYGTTEAFGACVRARGGQPAPSPPPKDPPVRTLAPQLCEIDFRKLGADGFAAKYGDGTAGKQACLDAKGAQSAAILARCKTADEPEACVKQALGQQVKSNDKPGPNEAEALAKAFCAAKAKAAGSDDRDRIAACVKAALPRTRAVLASCKASADGDRDALKRCVLAALKSAGSRR